MKRKRIASSRFRLSAYWIALVLAGTMSASGGAVTYDANLLYINTSFENASPLYWEIGEGGVVHVYLVYDQERASPNRANGHWFFQAQTRPGAEVTFVLHNFDNVWNGKKSSVARDNTLCVTSEDATTWSVVSTRKTDDNGLTFKIAAGSGSFYVARMEPYRLADLEELKHDICERPNVDVTSIGKTVQGRDLEIIRVGNAEAPYRVLLRARAHPWEAGGNWVVQGLIERLLRGDADARRCLDRYCVYIMPMANKDGVVCGWTRFNLLGADLNRKWDRPPDPAINPENHALENWLRSMVAKGQSPQLMIDFHNDSSGKLHVSRPNIDLESYLKKMERLEAMLREHTWFTEGSTGANYRNPGTIGEGLLERFGIPACVLELNANWIAGLNDHPSAKHWERFGAQLCKAFYRYFDEAGSN